jgi:hypothetical protein
VAAAGTAPAGAIGIAPAGLAVIAPAMSAVPPALASVVITDLHLMASPSPFGPVGAAAAWVTQAPPQHPPGCPAALERH